MSKRARKRRKGKRLEAAKVEKKLAMKMWRKLANTEAKRITVGYTGNSIPDSGYFYAPYMPVFRDGGYGVIVTDTTA